ncbi:MAG: ATP synthase F1 subunit gamma [Candidatus Paceibacterota bacterium]|jgi:F-type H+-transporting ATPase subunit gamma
MESLQATKRRIKGTNNIRQITKAMELVAATRMRKSQEVALNSRPYSFTALDLLANIVSMPNVILPPLLTQREVKHTLVVVVASDKGLAGSFNSSVFRELDKFLEEKDLAPASFIAVGIKSAKYLERKGITPIQTFIKVGDMTELDEVTPLATLVTDGYLSEKWDKVTVFSTHFRTALRQEVLQRDILPVDTTTLKNTVREIVPEHGRFANLRKELESFMLPAKVSPQGAERGEVSPWLSTEYIIEPSPTELLTALVPHLVLMQFYFLVLEANASEHAARRMAMESASSNAEDLVNSLTQSFNKSRQAAITREIIEVTSNI